MTKRIKTEHEVRLENTLDLLGTMVQNQWVDEYSLEGILDYASIDKEDFIQYLTKAEWFQGEGDKEQLKDLINDWF